MKVFGSHFILGDLNYYVLASKIHIVLQNTFAAVEAGYGQVRDRFGGKGRFKCGLRC